MNYQHPLSARVKSLWRNFEQSQAKDRAQLNLTIQRALETADAAWNKSPGRMSLSQQNEIKAKIVKSVKSPFFHKARAKWDDMLVKANLKVEYWQPTDDDMRRIHNALGDDDETDEEDDPVVPQVPHAQTQSPSLQPVAPSFSTSSRTTNFSSSSYAIVNPSEFNSEEEDDLAFQVPYPVAMSLDLTSEEDDDPAVCYPLNTRPTSSSSSGGHITSGFSRASSVSNPSSKPPSIRPLASASAYNAGRQQLSQNQVKSSTSKPKIPRQPYLGPALDTADDEPINEALEFERFKMKTRIEKIVEFHEAAALAEISLSMEIYKARKQLNNSKAEDAPRVIEHQQRMVQLQKEKEEQRKAIVKNERARRQSDLALAARRHRPNMKESSMSFNEWGPSSFQDEINLPSRFNLDTLLNPTNVENVLNEMFPANDDVDYNQPSFSGPPAASLTNSYHSSTSSNHNAFHGSSSFQNTSRQSQMFSESPKHPGRSLFGHQSSDEEEEDNMRASALPNKNTGSGIDNKPIWNSNNKPNAAVAGAWSSSKDVGATPSSSTPAPIWNTSKKATPAPRPQSISNNNPFFATDDVINPEPTATPVMNSKGAKGKKPWVPFSDKPSTPIVETPTTPSSSSSSGKAPATETPIVPPTPVAVPAPTTAAPAPAPTPLNKKQTKKQRQANKKGGGGGVSAAATTTTEETTTAIPEQEEQPDPEPVPLPSQQPQRDFPKFETSTPAMFAQHTSWLPQKMVPEIARTRKDSVSSSTFNWDDPVIATPRPASKIPAHLLQQESPPSFVGTPRPNSFLKKQQQQQQQQQQQSATSSKTTLEQMPLPMVGASKGSTPVWGGVAGPSPGPSLWGKTKADFEGVSSTTKVAAAVPAAVKQPQQQPVGRSLGGDFWLPQGFDRADEGVGDGGGGGGGGEEDIDPWDWITTDPKQIGKAAAPVAAVKQQQQQPSSVAAASQQRLRRASEATTTTSSSSPAPRVLGTKDKGQQQPQQPTPPNSSKKARGKKNGKGKQAQQQQQQKVTMEEVSDEEKDNIDILPQEYNCIMEESEKVILEPKPSVPSTVFDSIMSFAGGYDHDHDDGDDDDNDKVDENGYGYSSFFKPPMMMMGGSGSSSSPADDMDMMMMFNGNGNESSSSSSSTRFSNAFKSQFGGGGNMTAVDLGGGGMANNKHARWQPSFSQDREEGLSGSSPNFGVSGFGSRVQGKPNGGGGGGGVQQTPVWGQMRPGDKGKGKGK